MTDTESKEVELEELAKIIEKQCLCYPSVAQGLACKLLHEGYTKRPQDNNALEPLDADSVMHFLYSQQVKRGDYLKHELKNVAIELCSKFGKDNSGMVPNPNQGYDNGFGHSGPCQPNCRCDIAKFSPKLPAINWPEKLNYECIGHEDGICNCDFGYVNGFNACLSACKEAVKQAR